MHHQIPLDESEEFKMLSSSGLIVMMTRSSSHHLFQRLLDRCSLRVLILIALRVTSDPLTFLGLASHPVGSVALRSLLTRSVLVADLVFSAVSRCFFHLMTSKYGHGLVIPTLHAVDRPKKERLYALAADNALRLATKEYGCVSLYQILHEMRGPHKDRLLEIVAEHACFLSQDPYGNFVVQNVLSLENPFIAFEIAKNLEGYFARLSFQRHGSYIVELCLKSPYARNCVVREFRRSKLWIEVAKHEFGNFVAQSTLKIVREVDFEVYEELVMRLKPHFERLRRGNGKNTLKIIQMLEDKQRYHSVLL